MFSKTIVHLYPTVYKKTKTKPGLGDFLRGSIFLAQYAKNNDMNFKINIANHPLYKYTLEEAEKVYKEAPAEFNGGWNSDEVLNYLEEFKNSDKEEVLVNCNMFYDIWHVTAEIREYINSVFKFKDIYYETASTFVPEPYDIIHIRSFDHQVDQRVFSFHLNKKLCEVLDINRQNVVMSNNRILKEEIAKRFRLLTVNTKPAHTANVNDYRQLEDTVIDYIILSRASKIHTFSFYNHGSGFSEQCAVLHKIPITKSFVVAPTEFVANSLPTLESWASSVELYEYTADIYRTVFGLANKEYKFDSTKMPHMRLWEFVNDSNKRSDEFMQKRLGYGLI